jgi:hypothetical protein
MKTLLKISRIVRFIWKFLFPILIAFILSNLLIYYFKIDIGKVRDNDFLFNFLGILLGFAITIFTFIISLVEKVKEKVEVRYQNNEGKKKAFEKKAKKLYQEIKDDIILTFISVVIIGLLYITNIKIPKIYFYGSYFIDHSMCLDCLKLSLFGLNLYAIFDLIIISFKLSDTTAIMDLPDQPQSSDKTL